MAENSTVSTIENNIKLKLAPPWITYVNELKILFGKDPDIKINIEIHDSFIYVKLYVNDPEKAFALQRLLAGRNYEQYYVAVQVIPTNECGDVVKNAVNSDKELTFIKAFKDNPILALVRSIETVFDTKIVYVVFKPDVVQFFNDNLADIYGNISTLYENIARDVFNHISSDVFFCTDSIIKTPPAFSQWP